MPALTDLAAVRVRLEDSLSVVRHDRWLLGGLRDGRLQVLADSAPQEPGRRLTRTQGLTALARQALYEKTPLTFTLIDSDGTGSLRNWQRDWPSILYAPVGARNRRPVGLLIVGTRVRHWYPTEQVGYVSAIAATLVPFVQRVMGPLGRLSAEERRLADLMAEGLSDSEIAAATALPDDTVRDKVRTILTKLGLRSRRQLARLVPGRTTRPGAFLA